MVYDPFAQGSALDPNVYMDFLSQPGDPRLLAAGLSAGLSMLQPPRWGDTDASQIARAIGTGGESVAQSELLGQKAAESKARTDVAEARAEAARSRAEAAGSRAGAAGDRLGYQAERLALQRQRDEDRNRIGLLIRYQEHVKNINRQNEARRYEAGYSPAPVPTLEEFATKYGLESFAPRREPTLGTSVAPAAAAEPNATLPPGFRIVR